MSTSDLPPRRPARDTSRPIVVLVLGILGITTCALLAPMAWIWGAEYERDCERRGEKPEATAVVGRILGMVGTALFALAIVGLLLWVVLMSAQG